MSVGVNFEEADKLEDKLDETIDNINKQIKYLQKAVEELRKVESPSINICESITNTEENIRCSNVDRDKLMNFKIAFKRFVKNAKEQDIEQSYKLNT